MGMELNTRAKISGVLTTARDGGVSSFAVNAGGSKTLAEGTGANQANAIFIDDFTIAPSGTLDIDLAGTLVDPNGAAVVFTAIKDILVIALDANTNNIVVGGAPANGFFGPFGAATHTAPVVPGGHLKVANHSAAGWPVVGGTGDLLRLANSAAGTPVSGTIVIVGER